MLKKIILFTVLMVIAAAMVYAAPADVPKTGQTTSSATGDDGDTLAGVAWPSPRFTVGTGAEAACVTDNLTGLMWTKDANYAAPTKTWVAALKYANELSHCGHTDWRLPNMNELESLCHAEYTKETCSGSACATNAAWLNTQGFTNAQALYYWSSTTSAGDTMNAWIVSMDDGNASYDSKANSYYVWPVRSGQ